MGEHVMLPSAYMDTILLRMGEHVMLPSASLLTIPGRISISSPMRSTPCRMDPPATPPFNEDTSSPGLFTSKERMIIKRGIAVKFLIGTGRYLVMYSHTTSILYRNTADNGIIGALSATVPATNFLICSCCASAWSGFTRSTLFCNIMIFFNLMISTAAKCSEVCGCGQDSLPAISNIAASITAAPLSMVAMRISWPGQSTKDTCLTSFQLPSPSVQGIESGDWLPKEV